MHIHGAPFVGPAERNVRNAGSGPYGAQSQSNRPKLFEQPSGAPPHVADTASRRDNIAPRRLALFSKLAIAMAKPSSGIDTDNPDIPAGFTYLAQLAAHDITFSLTPFDEAHGHDQPNKNARHSRLILNTLYGLGPGVHPHLYNTPELG